MFVKHIFVISLFLWVWVSLCRSPGSVPHSLPSKPSIADSPGLTEWGCIAQLVHVTDGRIMFPLPNFCFVLNQQLSLHFFKAFSHSFSFFEKIFKFYCDLQCALLRRNFLRDSWELLIVLDWWHSHVPNIKCLFSNISSAKFSFSLLWGLWEIQLVKIVNLTYECVCMCMCICIPVCMFVCTQVHIHTAGRG